MIVFLINIDFYLTMVKSYDNILTAFGLGCFREIDQA